jgi:radical SAM superfamily enzyme YgiQ (UPF0313 family)
MKVKLILPDASTDEGTLSDFNYMLRLLTPRGPNGKHNVMAFMPLALPTLAALTPREWEVEIIDENIEPLDFDDPVDVVGITYVSFMARRAYEIADTYRERGVYVVLGGVHATSTPDEAAVHADTVVLGEAEETWPQFLEDFKKGKPRPRYRCRRRPDMSQAVVPRWDLVRREHYLNLLVQTTRGCSFRCDFCQIRSLYGPPRYKAVEQVIKEIEEIGRHKRMPGPLKLMFADDNIVGNISYAKKLFRAMIPLGVKWTSQASINIADDPELLSLAAQSGCDSLLIGFESVSQKSLDSVNKGKVNRVDDFRRAVDRIQAQGINLYSYMIFGFDDNDASIFQETLRFVQEAAIEFPLFNVLSPIPGTKLFDRLAEADRLVEATWEKLNGYNVCFKPQRMTRHELRDGFLKSIMEAYSQDALLDRLRRSYDKGAARGTATATDYLLRAAVTAMLLREAARETSDMRRFIRQLLLLMWSKRDFKLHTLIMSLDRFDFARQLRRRYPHLPRQPWPRPSSSDSTAGYARVG